MNLSKDGSSAPGFAASGLDKEESGTWGVLKVGGDGERDVRAGAVEGDGDFSRALDHLLLNPRRHGQGVLSSVDADPELVHDLSEGYGSIVHQSSLPWQLCRPHPVALCLHILQRCHLGPDQVGHALCHRHASVGCSAQEPLDRLLSDRRHSSLDSLPVPCQVGMRNDGTVGEGGKEGTNALLLGNEARDAPVHLVGEESLRADGDGGEHGADGGREDFRARAGEERLHDGGRIGSGDDVGVV
mmetsp:Transcript_39900/g.125329  ORF Transcript_39900/g.125329 Transcript_39900/m.125329 type:complete len:243 (-) Transcript_39900:1921-2649(-)